LVLKDLRGLKVLQDQREIPERQEEQGLEDLKVQQEIQVRQEELVE
jgi:hypothetical protein